jgi:hypothetical protein
MSAKQFSTFLTEAQFSEGSIERVLTLLVRLLEKTSGQKFYRYGGEHGAQEVEYMKGGVKGKGYLYFTEKRLAVRFNVIKGEFVGINFWKHWAIGRGSDAHFWLNHLNIVQVYSTVLYKIKRILHGERVPPSETIPVQLKEAFEMVAEAAGKPTHHEYYQMVKAAHPDKEDEFFRSMHWQDIVRAAVSQGGPMNLPGFIKAQPKGKGLYSVIPGDTGEAGSPAPSASPSGPSPTLFIKVTAQDPVTKKFLSAADSKEAQDMYGQIQQALADNSPQMAKKEVKDPNTLFGNLANLTKLVIKGTNKSLLIYGGPGTGKSWTITNEIAKAGMVKNQDWYHIKGKITTSALYQTLFLHRNEKLIVFDDCDSVFGTEDSANILKAALDSYDERYISWISTKTTNVAKMNDREREEFNQEIENRFIENPEDTKLKFPSEFKYEGRIIFISNLPEGKLDTAILSRSFKINMDLTDEQMFMRMEQIIDHLGEASLSRQEKLDTLRILKERNKLGELKRPNMRTFVAASKIRASGIPNWIDLLEYS